jgi:hypothetical protein
MRRIVVVAVTLVTLTACEHFLPSDPWSPLALHQQDGSVVVSLGCERESVQSVVIEQGISIDDPPDAAVMVWGIEAVDADGGAPLEDFTVGVVPEGFVETDHYAGPWTGGFITVAVLGGGTQRHFDEQEGIDGWRFDPLLADDPDGSWAEYQEFVTTAGDDLGGWACDQVTTTAPVPQG